MVPHPEYIKEDMHICYSQIKFISWSSQNSTLTTDDSIYPEGGLSTDDDEIRGLISLSPAA